MKNFHTPSLKKVPQPSICKGLGGKVPRPAGETSTENYVKI